MAYTIVRRRWPYPKRTWMPLLAYELLTLVPCLVLFGISQPDLFRALFWQIGYDYGFNSNPNTIIFAVLNGQTPPSVPFVWSTALNNFNVVISVLNLFFLIAKMTALIMGVYYPILAVVVSTSQLSLWVVSIYGQLGPDYLDPLHPSPMPWYMRKSCDLAAPWGATDKCYIARGSLAATVVVLLGMLANLGLSLFAMKPRENAERPRSDDDDDDGEDDRASAFPPELKSPAASVHMRGLRSPSLQATSLRSPNLYAARSPSFGPSVVSPFTPRTQAFNTLDGRLPLRQYP